MTQLDLLASHMTSLVPPHLLSSLPAAAAPSGYPILHPAPQSNPAMRAAALRTFYPPPVTAAYTQALHTVQDYQRDGIGVVPPGAAAAAAAMHSPMYMTDHHHAVVPPPPPQAMPPKQRVRSSQQQSVQGAGGGGGRRGGAATAKLMNEEPSSSRVHHNQHTKRREQGSGSAGAVVPPGAAGTAPAINADRYGNHHLQDVASPPTSVSGHEPRTGGRGRAAASPSLVERAAGGVNGNGNGTNGGTKRRVFKRRVQAHPLLCVFTD
jgi:hypothetical protein